MKRALFLSVLAFCGPEAVNDGCLCFTKKDNRQRVPAQPLFLPSLFRTLLFHGCDIVNGPLRTMGEKTCLSWVIWKFYLCEMKSRCWGVSNFEVKLNKSPLVEHVQTLHQCNEHHKTWATLTGRYSFHTQYTKEKEYNRNIYLQCDSTLSVRYHVQLSSCHSHENWFLTVAHQAHLNPHLHHFCVYATSAV